MATVRNLVDLITCYKSANLVDLADPGNVLQIGIGRILILLESTRQNYQCRAINIDIVDLNGFKRLGRVHGKCLSLVNFYDARMHVIVILILIVIVLNFNDAMYQEIEIILV